MKRILSSILAFLYLSTSIGATVHLHYCMGKLISWGFVDHDSKNCSFCGMEKQNGTQTAKHSNKNCCRDEHKTVSTGKDKKVNEIEFRFVKFSSDPIVAHFPAKLSFNASTIATEHPKNNAPPFLRSQPIFLLNRNFRI